MAEIGAPARRLDSAWHKHHKSGEVSRAMGVETTARTMYEALAAGDGRTVLQLLDPAFKGIMTAGLPFGIGGTYDGPQAMLRQCWARVAEHYALRPEPAEYLHAHDGRLVVLGRYRGTARRTGRPVEAAFVHVLRFAGDRILEWRQVTDTTAWYEALEPR